MRTLIRQDRIEGIRSNTEEHLLLNEYIRLTCITLLYSYRVT